MRESKIGTAMGIVCTIVRLSLSLMSISILFKPHNMGMFWCWLMLSICRARIDRINVARVLSLDCISFIIKIVPA